VLIYRYDSGDFPDLVTQVGLSHCSDNIGPSWPAVLPKQVNKPSYGIATETPVPVAMSAFRLVMRIIAYLCRQSLCVLFDNR